MQQRVGMVVELDQKKVTKAVENGNWFSRLLFWIRQKMSHQSLSVWSRKRLEKELKELEDIFGKAAKNELVLKGLNITFEKGKIYSLVGYNGAGKTTLTKLLKRTIDPTRGEILVNGKSLTTVEPLYWKKYLASLEQENFLWESLSIRDNLLLGQEGKKVSDKEIFKALEKVGLKDKVKDLDAIIGEGVELSGGQNQLLEIARVLIQKKPIVILDEGTNQLDAEKEAKIMALLQEIKQHSIVIFITHRMTTCRNADQILVLENGKLTSQGSPQELLKAKKENLFQKFWKLQVVG
ncbi:MAG: ABC transporter ATP-binding protein [bacterium]